MYPSLRFGSSTAYDIVHFNNKQSGQEKWELSTDSDFRDSLLKALGHEQLLCEGQGYAYDLAKASGSDTLHLYNRTTPGNFTGFLVIANDQDGQDFDTFKRQKETGISPEQAINNYLALTHTKHRKIDVTLELDGSFTIQDRK